MSVTPPKFIQQLQARNRDDLVSQLRSLVDCWERHAENLDKREAYESGEAFGLQCAASALKDVLDKTP